MDVAELFDYARTSLDSDDTELPDTLLGAWMNAAENRMYAALAEATRLWSISEVVTGDGFTQSYAIATQEVRVVNGAQWQLEPIPQEFATERWPRNAVEGSPQIFGLSTHWSIDEGSGSLWLWPAPNTGDVFHVSGLTRPQVTPFTDTTTIPVLPVKYHALIGEYLVARGAEMQQNLALASMKMNRFESELDALGRIDKRPTAAGVVTVGSVQLRGPNVSPDRFAWPWE